MRLYSPVSAPSHTSSACKSCGDTSYSATNTEPAESGTIIGSAPSQPCSSPPKVSRQPCNHPVPAAGECGHRSSICSGSILEPYAAYRPLELLLTSLSAPHAGICLGGAYRGAIPGGDNVSVTR